MKNFGVQLYSFKNDCSLDLLESIKKAGEIGYTAIEFARGYDDIPVETMKKTLEEAGVQAVSAHVRQDFLDNDLEYLAALGVKYIIDPMESFSTKEEAKELADKLNAFGEKCAKYGIKTGYHNHRFEFFEVDGKYLLEWLMEYTNPETVVFELDCGWCSAAGAIAPVDFINKHKGRIAAIHIKENSGIMGVDAPTSAATGEKVAPGFKNCEKPGITAEKKAALNVPQGLGIIDWNEVKAAADAQYDGVIYIVEREASYNNPKDRVACLAEDAAWIIENM